MSLDTSEGSEDFGGSASKQLVMSYFYCDPKYSFLNVVAELPKSLLILDNLKIQTAVLNCIIQNELSKKYRIR